VAVPEREASPMRRLMVLVIAVAALAYLAWLLFL
jgi:hypothetical protein